MRYLILLTVVLGLSVTNTSSAQSKLSQKEKFQATYNANKALTQTQNYQFTGEWIFSNKSRKELDTATNQMRIDTSKCSGQLDTLEPSKPVNLNGAITNYNLNFDDTEQRISIEFTVNGNNVSIDVKPNGNAFLTVKNGVDNITQRGKLQNI